MPVRFVVVDNEFKEALVFRSREEAIKDAKDCEAAGRGYTVYRENWSRQDISASIRKSIRTQTRKESPK